MKRLFLFLMAALTSTGAPAQTAYQVKIVSASLSSMTANSIYMGYITPAPILNVKGTAIGDATNSSFVDGAGIFSSITGDSTMVTADSPGKYFLNHTTGYFKVSAKITGTPSVRWRTPDTDTLIVQTPILLTAVSSTPVDDSVAVGTSSITAFSADPTMLSTTLTNLSAVTMFLAPGGTAKMNSGIPLLPNQSYTFGKNNTFAPFTGTVTVIAASGSGNLLLRTVYK